MQVLIAYTNTGKPTKFYRHDAWDCPGLRKGELADGADYEPADVATLPGHFSHCQFETCFPGRSSAAEIAADAPAGNVFINRGIPVPLKASGIAVGVKIEFRDLGTDKLSRVTIVRGRGDRAKGELAADTPIARGLLGREAGEKVDIELPNRSMSVEILSVRR